MIHTTHIIIIFFYYIIKRKNIQLYNPAMLERIIARNDFIIFSFSELLDSIDDLDPKRIETTFNEYGKLAAITQGVDVVPCGNEKLICKNVWGFYALYYNM